MTDIEYGLLRKRNFIPEDCASLAPWDVLISAFTLAGRVREPFRALRAAEKHWLVHREYDFRADELPADGRVFAAADGDEAEFWHAYLSACGADAWTESTRICLDITGFMRPHLMLLPLMLRDLGLKTLDVLYSEPLYYEDGDRTAFTKGAVIEVRQVRGFEGLHEPDSGENEVLVVGVGYDAELIRHVAEFKRAARKLQMFGLPSLRPHMYGENQLQVARAEESIGSVAGRNQLFAPANDPFATAQVLHDRLRIERAYGMTNLYLSPLSTKPQALGFALYYLAECQGTATSIVFPLAEFYSKETSVGWASSSLYTIELDWF